MKNIPPQGGSGLPPPSDEARLRELFESRYPSLVYFFQQQWRFSREEARDLAQDTFLRVHMGMDGFRRESSLDTWLFKIAKNLASNRRRYETADRRQHEAVSIDDVADVARPTASVRHRSPESADEPALEEMLARERLQRMRQAILDLPERMRQVLLLRIDQELKYREIADELGMSIETVKAHLSHAKDELTRLLNEPLTPREVMLLEKEDGDA